MAEEKPSGSRPVPDPTLLTTQQLLREMAGLRELVEARINGLERVHDGTRQIIETRLDGMDKAIELIQATADRFPARIDEKISALGEVHEEKFRSIQVQFIERDVRTEQTSRDSKVAVDAALSAAKEAVEKQNQSSALAINKSETATMKQIDQQGGLISTVTKAIDEKIDDVKERLTRIEGVGTGVSLTTKTNTDNSHWLISILLGVAAFVAGHFLSK